MPTDSMANGCVRIHVVKLLIFSTLRAQKFFHHILAPGCRSFDSCGNVSGSDAQAADMLTLPREERPVDHQWFMDEMTLSRGVNFSDSVPAESRCMSGDSLISCSWKRGLRVRAGSARSWAFLPTLTGLSSLRGLQPRQNDKGRIAPALGFGVLVMRGIGHAPRSGLSRQVL